MVSLMLARQIAGSLRRRFSRLIVRTVRRLIDHMLPA
jgi:hypothetical protein